MKSIFECLTEERFILVEGPPRSGKSVLAGQIHRASLGQASLVDALSPGSAGFLLAPDPAVAMLGPRSGRTLIIDNADRDEGLLDTLSRLAAESPGSRLVALGSAFPPGLAACRLSLSPLGLLETGTELRNRHWLRGGFPEALYAQSDEAAFSWLRRYAGDLADGRLGDAGLSWAPGRTRNLLSMIAHSHAEAANESAIARSLGVSRPTVARAIAALVRAGHLRELPSLASPAGKRVRKGAALYVRDTGLCHCLLGIANAEALLGHPRLFASWEGYVVEQAMQAAAPGLEAARYLTQDGAGLELLLMREGRPVLGAAIRWARPTAAPPRGMRIAMADLGLEQACLVVPEGGEVDKGDGVRAMGLPRFLEEVSRAGG